MHGNIAAMLHPWLSSLPSDKHLSRDFSLFLVACFKLKRALQQKIVQIGELSSMYVGEKREEQNRGIRKETKKK